MHLRIETLALAPASGAKETSRKQHALPLAGHGEREVGGIAMGVLSDGTPYLNQRGLAALCGVRNAHIGSISSQWNAPDEKPRIQRIKSLLNKSGRRTHTPHVELTRRGVTHFCYPADICLAILEYYAFDAGSRISETARDNFRLLARRAIDAMGQKHF
jgi:hypothetical protein